MQLNSLELTEVLQKISYLLILQFVQVPTTLQNYTLSKLILVRKPKGVRTDREYSWAFRSSGMWRCVFVYEAFELSEGNYIEGQVGQEIRKV